MPLTRYQIRSEYGLADPELYRAADKDDPEALLEGVAMAGLVGVLRQLGDLAEFAAEIFHDLHEEVLATASRGHSLMARVQQLEVEFPLIEKALLSQTNHLSFFSNQGVDWHPNMRSKQNLIAQGDLPRFIMDSYEECRGPPRLFLLDKFDVAGAGACLKRYSDPSFFRGEASVDEVQRERKVRRVKKKGMRGRNGQTPEILPASHAKLQQLFMEESIVNSYNNPSCIVKLKKRQFNEPPFCSINGKSYMGKFVETPSPESKTVREVSIAPPSLRWTTDCESGNEVVDVNMVSPKKNLSKEKGSSLTSITEALLPEPSFELLDGMVVNGKEMEEPEPPHSSETCGSPTLYEAEKKEVVDAELKMHRGMDVCHSDEITSEVENYVDALATMESEAETDNEYRAKSDKSFLNDEKNETDSDTNEEHLELQAQYSDSQSLGYSASEDGNTSLIKGSSSFTCSDGQSNLVDNIESDGEGIARAFPSAETSTSHQLNMTYTQLAALGGTREIEDDEISDLQEASTDLCSIDVKAKLSPSAHGHSLQVEPEAEGSDQKESELDRIGALFPDAASQKQERAFSPIASESNPIFQSVEADPKVSSAVLMHSSTVLDLAREHDSNISYKHEEFVFNHTGTVTSGNIIPWHSKTTLPEDPFHFLVVPEASGYSDLQSLPDSSVASSACNSDMANLHGTNSEGHPLATGLVNLENPIVIEDKQQTHIIKQQSFDFTYDAPLHEQNAPEVDLQPLQEDVKFGKNEPPKDFDDVVKVSWKAVEVDAGPLNFPSNSSILSENTNMHDVGTERAPVEQFLLPTPVIAPTNDNASTSVDPAADIVGGSADSQEPPPDIDHLPQKECDSYEEVFPECNKESNLLEEARDVKVAYAENNSIPSDLISHPESEVETQMQTAEQAPMEQLLLPTPVIAPTNDNASTTVDPAADIAGGSADSQEPPPDIDHLPQKECDSCEKVFPVIAPTNDNASTTVDPAADIAGGSADSQEPPPDIDHLPQKECDSCEKVFPVIAPTNDNASTTVDPAADIAGGSADSREPPPDIDHLPQKECDPYEKVFPECNKESNLLEEARDAKVAYAENNSIASDLISHPESEVETEMPGLSFMEKSLSRHSSDDAAIGSGYAELGSKEPQPKPSSQGHLPWSSEDILSSLHVDHQVDQGETPEHLSDVPPQELDLNLSCEDEVSPRAVNPESQKLQSADLMVRESILSSRPGSPLECPLEFQNDRSDAECLQGDETRSQPSTLLSGQLQSSDSTGKEKYAAFESSPGDQPTQHSTSESLQKSASLEVDGFSPVGPSLHTNIAISPQASDVAEINHEDVPNLAPLPPSEWTIGSDRHVLLASQSKVIEDGQDSFQLLQRLPAEEIPQLQLSASEGGLIWPLHTFLNVENEKLRTEEREDKLALPGPLSSLTQVPDGNSVIQHNSSVMEATELPDHFSTSVSEHAFLDWGRGVVQSNLNSLPPHPVVEDGPSRNDPVSSQGEVTQYIESTSSVSKDKVQQNFHEKSEAQHESSRNASGPSDTKQDEHFQYDLFNLDGERALEETSVRPENEVVQPNEKLMSNIPRPPKRLIEAVAAHDRSMLRKVTERIKPPIEPRANERDSLLEQIRTKSFNLKPAAITRPSIQGPKTNLKVNAILEKANAIRQAFAGSDEDDEDNWSDC